MFFYAILSILILVVLIIATILITLRQYLKFWARQGLNDFTIADYKGLLFEQNKYNLELSNKFGKVYGGFLFLDKYLAINDPEIIREVFVKSFSLVPDHKHIHLGPSPKVSNIVFFIPGDDNWKRIRSIITPAFTSGKLKAMMASISEISDKFVKSLKPFEKSGEVLDMRKHLGAFAMEVISSCAYGIDLDAVNNPDHPIMVNAKKVLSVDTSPTQLLSILFPKVASLLRLNFFDVNAINYFDQLFNEIVKNRRSSVKQQDGQNGHAKKKKTDFIQLMLDLEKTDEKEKDITSEDSETENKDRNNSKTLGSLSSDELTAQGIIFFIAGYDTTSSSLSHVVYYLSVNKDCQQRLYEELKDVKEFSYETLPQLKYLCAVIDESLRLSPPLLRIQRQGSQDFEIKGIRIPAGTTIDVLPYALHRDPDLWPDPLEFKPERFLEPRHHPWAYMPFGGGPRVCLGKRFALQEMRMCCAKLFRNYQVDLAPGFNLEYFRRNVILLPKSMKVILKVR